ncbi:MAG: DUF4149 domain-containing protein [Planctomycetota bacterium]
MLTATLRAVRGLSVGIWLGAGVMTFIAAHYVFFGGFIDKTTAGDIMGSILHAGGWMKIGLAVLALGAHLVLKKDSTCCPKAEKTALVTLAIASLIAGVVALYLEPKMLELRAQFRNDPNLLNPAHVQFGKLHGASMGLALLELICIAITLICIVI